MASQTYAFILHFMVLNCIRRAGTPRISFLKRMQARARHCDSGHVQSEGKGCFCLACSLSRRVTQAYPRNKALAIVIICIDA